MSSRSFLRLPPISTLSSSSGNRQSNGLRTEPGIFVRYYPNPDAYNVPRGLRKDINLKTAISDAIKILQNSVDRRQIQIEIDCDNVPQEIRIQESQFHQMLVNLIKNSIEAIDELAKSDEFNGVARIRFRTYISGDFLCLEMTDTGIGIDSEDINRIFWAGFTNQRAGNGLRLAFQCEFCD